MKGYEKWNVVTKLQLRQEEHKRKKKGCCMYHCSSLSLEIVLGFFLLRCSDQRRSGEIPSGETSRPWETGGTVGGTVEACGRLPPSVVLFGGLAEFSKSISTSICVSFPVLETMLLPLVLLIVARAYVLHTITPSQKKKKKKMRPDSVVLPLNSTFSSHARHALS